MQLTIDTRRTAEERLRAAVTAANERFVTNADRLAARFEGRRPRREISAIEILLWLSGVDHEVSRKMHRAHGCAHVRDMRVTYNAATLASTTDEDLEDLVLHEIGHLWCAEFLGQEFSGHGWEWRWVGWIVGYVPLGSTSDRRRAAIRRSMIVHRVFSAAGHFNPQLGF